MYELFPFSMFSPCRCFLILIWEVISVVLNRITSHFFTVSIMLYFTQSIIMPFLPFHYCKKIIGKDIIDGGCITIIHCMAFNMKHNQYRIVRFARQWFVKLKKMIQSKQQRSILQMFYKQNTIQKINKTDNNQQLPLNYSIKRKAHAECFGL